MHVYTLVWLKSDQIRLITDGSKHLDYSIDICITCACIRSDWIQILRLAQTRDLFPCKHSACKHNYFKPGLRVEIYENSALAFSCGLRIPILCVLMKPSTHPSTSSLRSLNSTTSCNNNNVRRHAWVHAAEDIEPIMVTREKYYAPLPLHWKSIMDNWLAIFVFFWFCSVYPSTVWLYTVCKL